MSLATELTAHSELPFEERESIIVRLAGDSGDGMQLAGGQLTNASAILGNDVSTFPDYPAEIRAPAGTLAGVSGFQVHFSSEDIKTPGDALDALVAMNPAALKANLADLKPGGILLVNEDSFGKNDLKKAGYAESENPLAGDDLSRDYRLWKVPVTRLNKDAVADTELSGKAVGRCKNFFALGLLCWLFDRPTEPTLHWVESKFAKLPEVAKANTASFKAGYFYGETVEAITHRYRVAPAPIEPGLYRQITGNQALAYGMAAAANLAGKELIYCSYPITPASDVLHELSKLKHFGVKTFQAEDEIAAMGAAIGAGFGGAAAWTGSSGPGVALKAEAMGLAVMTELPVVVINVQRGGPSTGLPTKTEQSDLLQMMFGRNGECPVPIVAPAHPSDCFDIAREAQRIAIEYMTPVILLSDGYIANGAEPWKLPDFADLPKIAVHHPKPEDAAGAENGFLPYTRDDKLARPWAVPGTEGFEHRIGGLEKQHLTGNVSYDPANHEYMVKLRQDKIDGIADGIPEQTVDGPAKGDLLVLSWGGTYGAVSTACTQVREKGRKVAHAHVRYLNPFPRNLGRLLTQYKQVLIPELNMGQLRLLIRAKYQIDAKGHNKIQGKPFLVGELVQAIEGVL